MLMEINDLPASTPGRFVVVDRVVPIVCSVKLHDGLAINLTDECTSIRQVFFCLEFSLSCLSL